MSFNVFSGRFWKRYFTRIIVLKDVVFHYIMHQDNFEKILNPPPYQTINPDIYGKYIGFMVGKTHCDNIIDFGIGPSDG